MQRLVILGITESHLLSQRANWHAGNPGVKVVKATDPFREISLLARWGGKNVPRYSMEIEFEDISPIEPMPEQVEPLLNLDHVK